MDSLVIKTGLQICKSPKEVFQAIIEPEQMKNYFISESSGIMQEGKTVVWKFPEFDVEFPIRIGKIEKDSYISFHWYDMEGIESQVEITLSEPEAGLTFIQITEGEKPNNPNGIKWLKSNTEGWANFLAFMKAWLEYGINLRIKAFNKSQLTQII